MKINCQLPKAQKKAQCPWRVAYRRAEAAADSIATESQMRCCLFGIGHLYQTFNDIPVLH